MRYSKSGLMIGVLIFSVLFVYGLALVTNLLSGDFLLVAGLSDPGYVLLSLAIFLPAGLCVLLEKENHKKNMQKMLMLSLFFICSLYFLIYLTLELGNGAADPANSAESTALIVITFLVSLFFTALTYVGFNRRK